MTRRDAGVTTNPDPAAGAAEPARTEVRLRMKPNTAALGFVDGAWWPRSHDPAAEFPGLVLAMSSWVGPVHQVAYHLDDWDNARRELNVEGWTVTLVGLPTLAANTIVVTGSNQRRRSLLVVPSGTPGGAARAVLRSTARADTVASAKEILASNGVRLDRRTASARRPRPGSRPDGGMTTAGQVGGDRLSEAHPTTREGTTPDMNGTRDDSAVIDDAETRTERHGNHDRRSTPQV